MLALFQVFLRVNLSIKQSDRKAPAKQKCNLEISKTPMSQAPDALWLTVKLKEVRLSSKVSLLTLQ